MSKPGYRRRRARAEFSSPFCFRSGKYYTTEIKITSAAETQRGPAHLRWLTPNNHSYTNFRNCFPTSAVPARPQRTAAHALVCSSDMKNLIVFSALLAAPAPPLRLSTAPLATGLLQAEQGGSLWRSLWACALPAPLPRPYSGSRAHRPLHIAIEPQRVALSL
ncbi:hypothetical protein EVAR_94303_1 [Eumeta japonica]|uniref:Uncharacterized protein n=1 Tax=Eumeta variegata TaxID=151549 RepID=A0A4C1UF37_EUMVA|nr:hypothetical protein EVAR_94303_1 [Eumeta japonica]